MKREVFLRQIIEEKHKSLRSFAHEIGIPPSTLTTILKDGIGGTSIDTILLMCDKLNIDVNVLKKPDISTGDAEETKELYTLDERIHLGKYRRLTPEHKGRIDERIDVYLEEYGKETYDDIEAKVNDYRRELEAEKRARTLEASPNIKEA